MLVGVDVFDFSPVSLEEILRKLERMPKVKMLQADLSVNERYHP